MPAFPAFRTKPYYDALKTRLTTSLNEDGTLKDSAVQEKVAAAIAAEPTVVQAAADAVDANPTIADHETRIGTAEAVTSRVADAFATTLYDTDFGVVGDGVADDSAALQAMFDAAPNAKNTRAVLTKPAYFLGTGIVTTKAGLTVEGLAANGQNGYVGAWGTRLIVGPGVVGLTYGDGTSHRFNGPTIRNLIFVGQPGALGGLNLYNTSNWVLDRVIAYDFKGAGAYGIQSDGGASVNQYGTLIECGMHDSQYGLNLVKSNGIVMLGGYLDGNRNGSGTPAVNPPGTGSVGVRVASGDSLRAFGTRVQFYDTGFDLVGNDHELHGTRIEAVETGVSIAGDYNAIYGGAFNNFIRGMGSVGTAVLIQATADYTHVFLRRSLVFATEVSDLGTNTTMVKGRDVQLSASGALKLGSSGGGWSKHGSDANGVASVGHIYGTKGLWLDSGNAGHRLFFGTTGDAAIYRTSADALATDAGDTFATGRNTTANRPSASARGVGAQFFDTTLNKPIWSDGTNWRDAAGTIV